MYMEKNVRPKFVQEKICITLQVYMGEKPILELIDDLRYAFHTRVVDLQELKDKLSEKKTKKDKLAVEEEFIRTHPKYKNYINSFTP